MLLVKLFFFVILLLSLRWYFFLPSLAKTTRPITKYNNTYFQAIMTMLQLQPTADGKNEADQNDLYATTEKEMKLDGVKTKRAKLPKHDEGK